MELKEILCPPAIFRHGELGDGDGKWSMTYMIVASPRPDMMSVLNSCVSRTESKTHEKNTPDITLRTGQRTEQRVW